MPSKEEEPLTGPRGGRSTITKGGRVRTVIFLEPEEKRALKIAAAERECSASDVVRAALRRYLAPCYLDIEE